MIAQGLTFTSQTSMWSRWAPINERTVLVGISQMACFLESRDFALTNSATWWDYLAHMGHIMSKHF